MRDITYQVTTAPTPATMTPTWMRVPGIVGSRFVNGIALVCGTFEATSWKGPLMRMFARLIPMKVIISVVMISLTP